MIQILGGIEEDFFGEPRIQKKVRTNKEEETKPIDLEAANKFFGRDLLTILGQGPIKKNPKMNTKENREEPNTPEMDAQIKEIF
jgi:hypothetical protein